MDCPVEKIVIKAQKGGLNKKEKLKFDEALKRIDVLETLLKKVIEDNKLMKIENEKLKAEVESLKHYFVNGWDKTRIGDFGNKYNEV